MKKYYYLIERILLYLSIATALYPALSYTLYRMGIYHQFLTPTWSILFGSFLPIFIILFWRIPPGIPKKEIDEKIECAGGLTLEPILITMVGKISEKPDSGIMNLFLILLGTAAFVIIGKRCLQPFFRYPVLKSE